MLQIPKMIRGDESYRSRRPIPYRIYQTFKSKCVPPAMYEACATWRAFNPAYDYFFFDDDDIRRYISESKLDGLDIEKIDLLRAFDRVAGAGKADLFRYLAIYENGGCYFDVDTRCKVPLDQFLDDDDEVVSGIGVRGDFHQWGLIYTPKHAFMKAALELAVSNILRETFIRGYSNLEGLCGPPCLHAAIRRVLKRKWRKRFKPGNFNVNGYRFRILDGDCFGGAVEFKYPGYNSDLMKMKMKHWLDESTFS